MSVLPSPIARCCASSFLPPTHSQRSRVAQFGAALVRHLGRHEGGGEWREGGGGSVWAEEKQKKTSVREGEPVLLLVLSPSLSTTSLRPLPKKS